MNAPEIPTFNRAAGLRELLQGIEPRLVSFPEVEVFVSDDASAEDTAEVLAQAQTRFTAQGMRPRPHRHPQNIGFGCELHLLLPSPGSPSAIDLLYSG